ncbi:MFS transporter [Palleronia sp. LCG004]|uniref:MFS transporter n=1 Tax=Palleronia sp. LCG004 TaxID=3079304 RepID=UPI0029439DF1|nr:MFS transporter [Palleronia sp. LCG004]WOI56148.1 MFS transporter [Palleronia sp. LCG004]
MRDIRTPRLAVSVMFGLNGALFGIWASRIPAFVDRLAISEGALGLLLLCMAVGALVSFPLAGKGSDRMGAARLTRLLAAYYAVTLILLAVSPTFWMLGVALALFGSAHGAMDVAMNAWAAEVEREIGRPIMPVFHAMWSLGAGLGALSGYLAVAGGIGVPLHFAGLAVLLAVTGLFLSDVGWQSVRSVSVEGPVFAFPKGVLVLVGLIACAAGLGEGAMADWSAVYLIAELGTSQAQAALGYAVFSVTMVCTRLSGPAIIARLGPDGTVRAAGITAAIGGTILVLAGTLWGALLGFGLLGVGYATIIPLAFSRAAAEGGAGAGAGRAIASVATLGYGGMLVGPPLIGGLAELTTLRTAFAMLAILALAVVLMARVMRPAR